MKHWIAGKRKHFYIGAVLLVYLLTANQLYILFFLKNGKPVERNINLPMETEGVEFKLAGLQPIRFEGENLFQVRGFAFLESDPEEDLKIQLVLRSGGENIVFPAGNVEFPNMIQSYPDYTEEMDQAEFRALISKNVLKPGTYQIGILLSEEDGGSERYYVTTGSIIQKTNNTVKYIPPK